MPLFSRRKDLAVQSFVLKLVNNHCIGQTVCLEENRADSRVNLVLVVMVIPVQNGKPDANQAFMAVTKEFSNNGVAVVFDELFPMDEAVLGFRFEGEMTFIRSKIKHRDPMGGGFFQIGIQFLEVVSPGEYPSLKSLGF